MKKALPILPLLLLLCLVLFFTVGCKESKMPVTFVNQTDLPVHMFVSGITCSNENLVPEQGMRNDNVPVFIGKHAEEFEVAVNNHVLVRKSLEWKEDAKSIVVVYNGVDLLLTY